MKQPTLLTLLVITLFLCSPASAQVTELNLDPAKGCNYYGNEKTDSRIYGFSSSREAQQEVQRIVSQIGLPANFVIKAANVPNAQAQVDRERGQRYILYSQQFMEELHNKSGDYWAKVAVLAHEIGHHLSGHTLSATGSRPTLELEADEFSGFVLYKLGASLQQAQSAVKADAPNFGTETHPPRGARLEAIAVGYSRARETGGRQSIDEDYNNPPSGSTSYKTGSVTLGGETYSTIQYGDLTWMTKNLNYKVDDSRCYNNDSDNCRKYGRLYTWKAAKKACASVGWRLPTDHEWRNLAKRFGGADDDAADGGAAAFRALIEVGNSGFSAQLGGGGSGDRYGHGQAVNFGGLGNSGIYWSGSALERHKNIGAWVYSFSLDDIELRRSGGRIWTMYSCRCVKD